MRFPLLSSLQVRDLNDRCVKKFVVPRRKECPAPQIRFGHADLKANGRMVSLWCEVGWITWMERTKQAYFD